MDLGIWTRKSAVLAILLTACGSGVALETRTFRLQSLDDLVALAVIDPYVYGDRPNAPGAATALQGVLSVSERSDKLDRISRFLVEL